MDWKVAKGMMADTNFLNSLQNMDVDGITPGQVRVSEWSCLGIRCTWNQKIWDIPGWQESFKIIPYTFYYGFCHTLFVIQAISSYKT